MLVRGLLNFLAYTLYYLALAALPMATTVALYFTAPLMIVVMSVFILRERVSPARWLAVGLGFSGVILMVRPGGELFDWAALLPGQRRVQVPGAQQGQIVHLAHRWAGALAPSSVPGAGWA